MSAEALAVEVYRKVEAFRVGELEQGIDEEGAEGRGAEDGSGEAIPISTGPVVVFVACELSTVALLGPLRAMMARFAAFPPIIGDAVGDDGRGEGAVVFTRWDALPLMPSHLNHREAHAAIDFAVCENSDVDLFLGNVHSSFSFDIRQRRLMMLQPPVCKKGQPCRQQQQSILALPSAYYNHPGHSWHCPLRSTCEHEEALWRYSCLHRGTGWGWRRCMRWVAGGGDD
jgi:hypothetical protein